MQRLRNSKNEKIDPNDVTLLPLKDKFQKNHDEIVDINRQISELKERIEIEKNNLKVKSEEEMFKKEKEKNKNDNENSLPILPNKRKWFLKIIEKIKNIFKESLKKI